MLYLEFMHLLLNFLYLNNLLISLTTEILLLERQVLILALFLLLFFCLIDCPHESVYLQGIPVSCLVFYVRVKRVQPIPLKQNFWRGVFVLLMNF